MHDVPVCHQKLARHPDLEDLRGVLVVCRFFRVGFVRYFLCGRSFALVLMGTTCASGLLCGVRGWGTCAVSGLLRGDGAGVVGYLLCVGSFVQVLCKERAKANAIRKRAHSLAFMLCRARHSLAFILLRSFSWFCLHGRVGVQG